MNHFFYAKASALRDKYQSEYLSEIKILILSQIVAAVFANGDIFPKSICIEYDYASNLLDANDVTSKFQKLLITVFDDLAVKPFASMPEYYARQNTLTIQCLFN